MNNSSNRRPRPMLMKTELVQKARAGLKTETRRLIKAKVIQTTSTSEGSITTVTKQPVTIPIPAGLEYVGAAPFCRHRFEDDSTMYTLKPYYMPGDLVYLRETWRVKSAWSGSYRGSEIEYKAGGENIVLQDIPALPEQKARWKSGIHMPLCVARTFLNVLDVKVAHLQDISGQEVFREGVDNGSSNPTMGPRYENMQRMAFQELWDSLAVKSPAPANENAAFWMANPWVWVVQFELVDKPSWWDEYAFLPKELRRRWLKKTKDIA